MRRCAGWDLRSCSQRPVRSVGSRYGLWCQGETGPYSHHLVMSLRASRPGSFHYEEKRSMCEVMNRFNVSIVEKVSPMIIHSALCISHVVPKGMVINRVTNLPRAAVLYITQDMRCLSTFCPADDEACSICYTTPGQIQDYSSRRNKGLHFPLSDDTHILYRGAH